MVSNVNDHIVDVTFEETENCKIYMYDVQS